MRDAGWLFWRVISLLLSTLLTMRAFGETLICGCVAAWAAVMAKIPVSEATTIRFDRKDKAVLLGKWKNATISSINIRER